MRRDSKEALFAFLSDMVGAVAEVFAVFFG